VTARAPDPPPLTPAPAELAALAAAPGNLDPVMTLRTQAMHRAARIARGEGR
jgi:hypothetical protein